MPGRALIIGIEQYPNATDLAQEITGAINSAEKFFQWVTKGDPWVKTGKTIAASDCYVCTNGGTFAKANLFGTQREQIADAVGALVTAGRDQTDELYVYFSGHGYGFRDSPERRAVDILIGSDYQSAATGGVKCLKLQELQEKLWSVLGGLHHYYFIDACRNLISADAIEPIGLGRVLGKPADKGRPTKYTLYSTAYGTTAQINSGFGPALLDGLNGTGDAKGFAPNGSLYVMFEQLSKYVQTRIKPQRLDQNKDGTGDGYIVEVQPVPTYNCAIQVRGAASTDQFTVSLHPPGDPMLARTANFTGSTCSVPFRPGNYVVEVMRGTVPLSRVTPPPSGTLSFWDDCAAEFAVPAPAPPPADSGLESIGPQGPQPPPPPPPPPPPSLATVSIAPLPNVEAHAVSMATGESRNIDVHPVDLAPGDYEVTLRENGVTIQQSVTTLKAGDRVQFGNEPLDPVRASIANVVGGLQPTGAVEFSETLGPMANRDLGLWLTIMGASRIVRDPQTFRELKKFNLADITTFTPNSTGVYLLAAVEGSTMPRLKVAASPTSPVVPVAGLQGVYQSLSPTIAGPQLVTVQVDNAQPRTFASWCLPNRLTLFVSWPGLRGQLNIKQFVLPMFHLVNNLDQRVRGLVVEYNLPLRIVRAAYHFQTSFGAKRQITPVTNEDKLAWDSLLHAKWLDPVMSLLACYEILRRGDEHDKGILRNEVLPNLNQYFAGIPDIAAIAEQLDQPYVISPHAPLFREGLLALPQLEGLLPLPPDRLDFHHIWTAWRGAPGR
jgi:Caspase domain